MWIAVISEIDPAFAANPDWPQGDSKAKQRGPDRAEPTILHVVPGSQDIEALTDSQ
jgi:hypothetical protein